ncbi:MAG: transglutaminase family protein [Candidatus Nanopelagicales bacterium]|nr:transglutaminase family protein [Candidatus Nanopelagicales bacterium]
MSWRLEVVHTTGMKYLSPVTVSFNEVRMTPADVYGQLLINHDLKITPTARVQAYVDYWGTLVEAFDVHDSHTTLEVVSRNVVDTPSPRPLPEGMPWEVLRGREVSDVWCEFLRPSQYVDDSAADSDRREVVDLLRRAPSPSQAIGDALAIVRDRIRYTPGATSVSTTAGEAWQHGHGVCQDMSHVTLSLLRGVGIPARYVSGYLYSGDGEIGHTCVGESHAWVEVWNGGWFPCDPTNGLDVGEQHVVVARGRDYADVTPLKGIYSGGQAEALGVTVSVTRLPR